MQWSRRSGRNNGGLKIKKAFAFFLVMMMISCVAVAVEISVDALPEYDFVFHNGVEFGYLPVDAYMLGKAYNFKTEWIEAQSPENEPVGGGFGCIIYDANVADIENVRIEYRAESINRGGCIGQCAYHFEDNSTAYDSLSTALAGKYQDARHTEQDGSSYSVVKECYETVTSGLADAEINGDNLCARYSQWLVRYRNRPVLIDLSEMVDSNGNVVDCVLRYTLLPNETPAENMTTNNGNRNWRS